MSPYVFAIANPIPIKDTGILEMYNVWSAFTSRHKRDKKAKTAVTKHITIRSSARLLTNFSRGGKVSNKIKQMEQTNHNLFQRKIRELKNKG